MARNYGTGGPKAAAGTNGPGVSEREDLANFISMITRDETPFMSSIGKTKANAILHEWQTDELTPPGLNSQPEGVGFNQIVGADIAPYRTRLGNYTQLSAKTVSVSGTKRAVDQAGVADEYAYQLKKRGTELRRDVELSLIHTNQNSAQGGAVMPRGAVDTAPAYPNQFAQTPNRTFGGYQAFINFNGTAGSAAWLSGPTLVVDATGATPTGVGAWTAPTNPGTGTSGMMGSQEAAFQLTAVDTLMQNIYQNGGKANKLMTSPSNRKAFSARAQGAGASSTNTTGVGNVRRNIDEEGSLRQSVEMYMSDFGDIMVVPNYIMGLSYSDATLTNGVNSADYFGLVYDSMWFNYASLRPLHEVDLGQLGDSIIGQIIEEGTLEVRNPKGCGLIVGLSGL